MGACSPGMLREHFVTSNFISVDMTAPHVSNVHVVHMALQSHSLHLHILFKPSMCILFGRALHMQGVSVPLPVCQAFLHEQGTQENHALLLQQREAVTQQLRWCAGMHGTSCSTWPRATTRTWARPMSR